MISTGYLVINILGFIVAYKISYRAMYNFIERVMNHGDDKEET